MPNTTVLAGTFSPIYPKGDELVIGTIAFLIIFTIFWKKLLPSIKKTLDERTDAIEGGMERAKEAQAAAAALQEEYQRNLTEARHQAAKITQDAREQGAAIVAQMRGEGQEQRDNLVAGGRTQLDADAAATRAALKGDLGSLAIQLASKIVGESLEDEARQRGTVDRFLSELEAKADAASGSNTAAAAKAGA
ncbi:F0F1 ATP synthase subunit B [Catenulispora pinisilvae]|uniref:F0F1 ATP synthase subunit B n=1 Tax=Catenulispora pinisilvae TaxID=2705253 RepID=UPI001890E778|nr:F0F1 ATP synthase subunit B [Catenulispora pinisilvae]